jgi:hypothetical protein
MPKFAIIFLLILTGCAPVGFEFRPEGAQQTIQVNAQAESQFAAEPLRYRLLADESHLIIWIDNPTNQTIMLLGDKSTVEDPTGDLHRLHGQTIDPQSSIKLVLPPLPEDQYSQSQPPAGIPQPGNPNDQPGFLPITGIASNATPSSTWTWDDGLEIRLDLLFQQADHPFEQHFVIRKVRK